MNLTNRWRALAIASLFCVLGIAGAAVAAPAAPIFQSVTPSYPTTQQSFTIAGTAAAGTTIVFTKGGTGSTLTDANGQWSITFGPMAGGTYSFQAVAQDAAGNASAPGGMTVIVSAGSPSDPGPTITDIGVETNKTYNAQYSGSLSIVVTFSELITVTGSPTIGVKIGSTATQFINGTAGTAPSCSMVFSFTPSQNRVQGTLNITGPINLNGGSIKGQAGADASLSFTPVDESSVVIDTIPPAAPTVSNVTPSNATSNQTFAISGSAEAAGKVVFRDHTSGTAAGSTTVDANGNWSKTFGPLAPGTYTYDVAADDAAGNQSDWVSGAASVNVAAATSAGPHITTVGPPADGTYNSGYRGYIGIDVSFSDAITVTGTPTLEFQVGSNGILATGYPFGKNEIVFQFSPADLNAQGTFVITGPIALNGGTIVGSNGSAASLSFAPVQAPNVIIDSKPPPVPVVTNITPASPTSDQSFTISGTAEAGDRVDYGVGDTKGNTTADANGKWSATVGPMPAGTYTVGVSATDPAGNFSSYGNTLTPATHVTVQPAPTTTPAARPVVSNATVSGQVGTAIAPVQVAATNNPTSFTATGLADYGLVISATGVITGTPKLATSGADVAVTAANDGGTSDAATIHLTIAAAPTGTSGGTQTITFASPTGVVMIGQPITLGATSSAGLPIMYSVVQGDAILAGDVLTPRSTALLVVRAASSGNATYGPASVDVSFGNPQKAAQTITADTSTQTVKAGSSVTLNATSTSGLPITYAVISGPATVSGNTLSVSGTSGTVLVRASQAGSDTVAAANDVTLRFDITPVPISRLVNISSRLHVSANDSAGASIAGFVLSGDAPKQILIRGVGPALSAFGVSSPLAAPVLKLYDNQGNVIATNAGWNDDAQIAAAAQAVGAFSFARGSKDAALLITLAPAAYTVQLQSSGAGTALIEVYDVTAAATLSRHLVNLSARGTVGSRDDVLIAGFVINGEQPKKVLIRGVGPALAAFMSGSLSDPILTVYDANQNVVARNDNWGTAEPLTAGQSVGTSADIASAGADAGAFPLPTGSADAALLLTLPPGTYSAVVTGANNAQGAALVEVYEVSP